MSDPIAAHHWQVYGHDWAVRHLITSMANHRVRHGYLLAGAEGVGKETLARTFAAALNCQNPDPALHPCGECRACRLIASGNHPDVLYSEMEPTSSVLKIEEIRSVMQRLALKPFEARSRAPTKVLPSMQPSKELKYVLEMGVRNPYAVVAHP